MHVWRVIITFALLLSSACAKTLVLLDTLDVQYTHSLFFRDLRDAGLDLEFYQADSKHLRLQSYGTWLYDNIAIFNAKQLVLGGAIDVKYLIEFVDSGRNVLVVAGPGASEAVREFASEMGGDLLEEGSAVQDYVSFSRRHGPSHILTTQCTDAPAILGEACKLPILYSGSGLTAPPDAALTMVVLSAGMSAESVQDSKVSGVVGSDIALTTSMQTFKNARVSVSGSLDMFSDEFYTAIVRSTATDSDTPTGNAAFCKEIARWTFRDKSLLRMENFQHRRQGEASAPPLNTYTVKDMITLEADILEKQGDEWVPHQSDTVVAQFHMLDPYIREAMQHDGKGHYSLTVKAPDVYGVFKWVIDYKKRGYSFLQYEEVTPLRPFRHNEFPRFVTQAYPYYATVVSLSVGFFVMIAYTMFHSESS